MTDQSKIFAELKSLIHETIGTEVKNIEMDHSFIDDLDADSLDVVELIMAIESRFDIEISDDDAEQISRVVDAVEFIARRKR